MYIYMYMCICIYIYICIYGIRDYEEGWSWRAGRKPGEKSAAGGTTAAMSPAFGFGP